MIPPHKRTPNILPPAGITHSPIPRTYSLHPVPQWREGYSPSSPEPLKPQIEDPPWRTLNPKL